MNAILRHVGRVKRLKRIVQREAHGLRSFERRAGELRAEAGRVVQELDQAQLRLAVLKAAPREVQAPSPASDREASHYGVRIVDGPAQSNLENERGRLASPVAGEVRIVPGRVAESDGPGLQFQAPVGTPVRAVAAGRVAFADRYGGYGQLVILDHGHGYYSAYGGLGSVDVRVGEDLLRHARIGNIGPDLTPPALFFEIRRGSRTLDPGSWFGY
jgi:septal ring factor EnvC (AmiA/AmiB activator)